MARKDNGRFGTTRLGGGARKPKAVILGLFLLCGWPDADDFFVVVYVVVELAGRRRGIGLAGDDEAAGMFGPAAAFVEAAMGADGADDAVCGRRTDGGFLDDFLQAEAKSVGAPLEEPLGVSVTVDGGFAGELEFEANLRGAAPLEEGLFDGVAVFVMADGAEAFVAFGIGRRGGIVFGEAPGVEQVVAGSVFAHGGSLE